MGNVILANPVPGVFGPKKIRTFSLSPAEFPISNVDGNEGFIATFTLPAGTNLQNPASVMMSPEAAMVSNIGINWAVVTGPETIKASIASNHSNNQNFTAAYKFYITVFEF